MAIKFFEWLRGSEKEEQTYREVSCEELFTAGKDYTLRKLAFDICVDMIANAIGRCDFREFREGEETFSSEWWLWNVEPNPNQNSTMFLHKLVDHLYRHNEALIISEKRRNSSLEYMAVADQWEQGEQQFLRQNEYTNVRVEGLKFTKTFREPDVLHLRLHQKAMEPVLTAMADSWMRMVTIAKAHYEWDHGQHWKVHISQMAAGAKDFEKNFAKMVEEQVGPFVESMSSVLPEFEGYKYELVSGGTSARAMNNSDDVRSLAEDIFDFTARGFLIPAVLINGKVEATADANARFLTYVIDPLCDQLQEEINRKRYGYEDWESSKYHLRVDSSAILHYDLFGQAANIEKLVGSGYSINEVRHAAGQEPINEPWADEHYMTKNIGQIGMLTE